MSLRAGSPNAIRCHFCCAVISLLFLVLFFNILTINGLPPPEVAEKGATSHFFQTLQQTKVIIFFLFLQKKEKKLGVVECGRRKLALNGTPYRNNLYLCIVKGAESGQAPQSVKREFGENPRQYQLL